MSIVRLYFTSEFKRNIRRLSKKYRHVRQDVEPLIEQLLDGQTPGEQIPRVQYTVFKVRLPNSDSGKGKRAGCRLAPLCQETGGSCSDYPLYKSRARGY